MENKEKLIEAANQMLERAYTPYSKFPVGAALLTKDGKIYGGCNIENAAYPVTICAERTALFKAVSEGDYDFAGLVVTSRSQHATSPCGSCRQVISEFCSSDMPVLMTHERGEIEIERTVGELLPAAFSEGDM